MNENLLNITYINYALHKIFLVRIELFFLLMTNMNVH